MERNGLFVFFCLKETLKSSFLINVSSYLLTQTPHYPLICPHLDLDKKIFVMTIFKRITLYLVYVTILQ